MVMVMAMVMEFRCMMLKVLEMRCRKFKSPWSMYSTITKIYDNRFGQH